MKTFLTFIFLFTSLSFTAVCKDTCTALINWKYTAAIDLFDKPGEKIIAQIKNDSAHEDYLSMVILDQNEFYFHVSISPAIKVNKQTGWIKKAAYIGAYIKRETFPMDFSIYKNTTISDSNIITIKKWEPDFLTFAICTATWTYISFLHQGKLYKGWIKTSDLCVNSYTTCN